MQLISIVASLLCVYADVVDAQLYMPWYFRLVWGIIKGPLWIAYEIVKTFLVRSVMLLFKLLKRKPPEIVER